MKNLFDLEQKTIVFAILDLVMVYLLTLYWFKYIEHTKTPVDNSLKYTIFVNSVFICYYFIFEYLWG